MDALVSAANATTTVATNAAAAAATSVTAAARIRACTSFQLTYKYVNFARALSVASGNSRT